MESSANSNSDGENILELTIQRKKEVHSIQTTKHVMRRVLVDKDMNYKGVGVLHLRLLQLI
jgi:hypothetical protein